jgi:glycosyltransferase involved in cell wall biosynthesis
MNVLWITNIQFPATCQKLGIPPHAGGGWMYSLAMELIKQEGIILSIGTVYDGKSFQKYVINSIVYYLVPKSKPNTQYDKTLEAHWLRITEQFNPDIIHIHGTEYAHGLACIRACPNRRFVISIQGLVSVYSEYYFAGINPMEIARHITVNDLKMRNTIFHGKKRYAKRGNLESDAIRSTRNIIGRTSWDYAHIKKINPDAEYHLCNEVLRKSFYNSTKWCKDQKTNYSIFLSQGEYPIKGLHQVLKALSLVRGYYPQVQLRIAGSDVTQSKTWVDKLRISGYGSYLRSLIRKLKLNDHVKFIGTLSEERMVEEYRNAHVFICPSSIENSPNSLGEAQIIGTPCVASFVGGVPDMIKDGETGLLYRFEEYAMLANNILRIFRDNSLAADLSEKCMKAAELRHDRDAIKSQIIEIYTQIIKIPL